MNLKKIFLTGLLILFLFIQSACSNTDKSPSYHNLFSELLGKTDKEVQAKIDTAWNQLFYGDDNMERVYYPVGNDMAYIMDIGNGDVRTEGMSYGMMIAVQLNKKKEFDCLWKWAKTYMYQEKGMYKGYFAWHCTKDGEAIHNNPASDGEEWFVTALFFAKNKWGNGTGIFNYEEEANNILNFMLYEDKFRAARTMFNLENKLVVFVPSPDEASHFTDPSYNLPHYYELWARWAKKDNEFWKQAIKASRDFLKKAADSKTGLMPDYAKFDGTPYDPWGGGHEAFRFDAWRNGMNVAVDYAWFAADNWAVGQSNRLLNFFFKQGIDNYGNQYSLDGKMLGSDHSLGLVSMNAVSCLAADIKERKKFVEKLWEAYPPKGKWRYYDGLLYMLALLNVSGNFKIIESEVK